ncbi:hypothetical protein RUM44_003351 [Polyplax serrata]|uniref:Uncharacterized protein n=1 Tax=Polyplax serrata TaxID=468196 RepID=A0ABR1AG95_POLSC
MSIVTDGLTIDSTMVEDAGVYTCEVVRPDPWSSLKLIQTLEVMYPPKIMTIPPNGSLEVQLGEKVWMGCSADGVPSPNITWRAKGLSVGQNLEFLEFTASTRTLSGVYQCEADNGIGKPIHANVILTILHEPEIETERSWIHTAPGIKTALVCKVVAEPEFEVVWLLNGEILKMSPPRVIRKTRGHESVLLFNPVSASDFGNYTCRATNRLGATELVIGLSGIANPAVMKTPQKTPPNAFNLIWEVDSFSPIYEYKLLFRKENDENWRRIIIPGDGTASGPLHSKSYMLYGLDRVALYEAKVFSRNRFGWSDSSDVLKFGFTRESFIEAAEVLTKPITSLSLRTSPMAVLIVLATAVTLFLNIYDTS